MGSNCDTPRLRRFEQLQGDIVQSQRCVEVAFAGALFNRQVAAGRVRGRLHERDQVLPRAKLVQVVALASLAG